MAWWKILAAGVVAGVAATAATSLYQAAVAPALGQDGSDDDPANVKAADDASVIVIGEHLPAAGKPAAGSAVHYATGVALGLGYAAAAAIAPRLTRGFGVPFGLGVALVLDDLLVPAFGWGDWPSRTSAATTAYGLSTHAVFGAVLEGGRRLTLTALARP